MDVNYTAGICGMKTITLDAPSPAFLSVTNGATSITAFTIDYVWSAAVLADIVLHTIPYTVVVTEYSAIASAHTGSFTFEILCPDTPDSTIEITPMEPSSIYDVASGATLSIVYPVIDVIPTVCFSVSYWEVQD